MRCHFCISYILFNQFVEEYEHKKNERIRSNEPTWDII